MGYWHEEQVIALPSKATEEFYEKLDKDLHSTEEWKNWSIDLLDTDDGTVRGIKLSQEGTTYWGYNIALKSTEDSTKILITVGSPKFLAGATSEAGMEEIIRLDEKYSYGYPYNEEKYGHAGGG